jgi:hypothetical protein
MVGKKKFPYTKEGKKEAILDSESLRDFVESKGIKTTAELNEALSEVKTAEDVKAIVDNSARLRTQREIVEEGKVSDKQKLGESADVQTIEKLDKL